jgi:WD40 repeat protein
MKILKTLAICLCLVGFAFSQTNGELLKFKARIGFDEEKERIAARYFSKDGTKLTLIGLRTIQTWDLPNAKLIESHPHEIVELDKFYGMNYEFSLDGSRVITVDIMGLGGKKKKDRVNAYVYDVQTGKRIAVLERPDYSVRFVFWSANGETLISFSGLFNQRKTEISFWNSTDFSFRKSFVVDGYTWHYLTRDGEKLYVGNGGQIRFLGLAAGESEGDVIRVYDTQTGAVEKELRANGEQFDVNKSATFVSSDERFIATSKDENIIVWETGKDTAPKYEITPLPKQRLVLEGFSDDGKYLLATQKFYDTATGQPVTDVPKAVRFKRDDYRISPDGKYALIIPCEKATVLETATDRKLYEVKSKCHPNYANSPTQEDPYPTIYGYFSDDDFRFSPRGKYLLNFHGQKLEVRDFLTGTLLQTVLRKTDEDFQTVHKYLPDWKIVGDNILVNGEDRKSILIWKVNEN